MDNFFEIIIYLFIFFSLISSLFGKKKKKGEAPPSSQTGQRTQPVPQQRTESRQTTTQTANKEVEEYDILREIENLFKMENEVEEAPVKETPKPVQKEIPRPQPKVERTRIESESKFKSKYDDYKKPVIDKSIEEQAKRFELNYAKKKETNNYIYELKKKLREPKTLKDAIVLAEIIGKRGNTRLKR